MSIFLPKVKKVKLPETMVNHKTQTGLANSNIEADENLIINEFIPIHVRTTTGIVVLLAFIFVMFCIYKASKRGMFTKCWKTCCRKAPTRRENQQACLPPEQQFQYLQGPLDSAPERVRFQDIRRAVREVVGQHQPSASTPASAPSGAKKKPRSCDASEC